MTSPRPDDREALLDARRQLKMARSAHAFVRGSTEQFYEWVCSSNATKIPQGPSVWICGDCHIGNLGPIGHPEGKAVVEMRDLDQTVLGNPAHDVLRLALSLAMSARSSDLPGVTTARLCEDLVDGYERAFEGEIPSEEIGDLPPPIGLIMKRAVKRTWKHLFEERIGKKERALPLGKTFWRLSEHEKLAVKAVVEREDVRKLVAILEDRVDDTQVSLVDAAFWVKGCSSLGLWRAAALVKVTDPKREKKSTLALLDLKQAIEPIAPWAKDAHETLQPAQRVVTGAKKLAPALGARMLPIAVLDRSVFVRELLPQDLKVELDHIEITEARQVAHYFGMVVGRAHRRQMDAEATRAWKAEMASHRTKNLDAPSWLWQGLTLLVALHERAYLEHCRRYALAADRLSSPSNA